MKILRKKIIADKIYDVMSNEEKRGVEFLIGVLENSTNCSIERRGVIVTEHQGIKIKLFVEKTYLFKHEIIGHMNVLGWSDEGIDGWEIPMDVLYSKNYGGIDGLVKFRPCIVSSSSNSNGIIMDDCATFVLGADNDFPNSMQVWWDSFEAFGKYSWKFRLKRRARKKKKELYLSAIQEGREIHNLERAMRRKEEREDLDNLVGEMIEKYRKKK